MKNGDRLTGSVIQLDGKNITIKTAAFGLISAPWSQVASLTTDSPIHIALQGGRTMTGVIAPANGRLAITSNASTTTVSTEEITALRNDEEQAAYERLLAPGLGQLWAGVASLGWAGTNGNAKTLTFTAGFNAARLTNKDKTSVNFSLIKASALINGVSASTAEAVRGGVGYNHNVSPRLFVNVFNDYEYDRFQNLDLRFVIGGGFGYHAVKTDRHVLDVLGGVDYNHSSFSTGLTRNSAEAFWGDEYLFKLNGTTSLTQSYRMFNNLSDTGQYRINFDLGLGTKLRKWVTWNVALSDRYLSNPVPGRKTNDWLYTTGLGVTFGK
jgi:putative salt-induced outer membrane protein YdiY